MEKIIRVTGQGKVSVAPDTIEIGFRIIAVEKDYRLSLKKVNDKVEALKEAVTALGIDSKNVLTQGFSVNQKTKSTKTLKGDYKDEVVGYETYHSIKVSFGYDTELLGKVIESISSTVAEPQISIGFTVKNQEGIKARCLDDAVKNAKEDAEALAKAAGVKLGELLSINHSFGEVRISRPARYEMCKTSAVYDEERSIGSSLSGMNVEDLNFGANVTAEWEIK